MDFSDLGFSAETTSRFFHQQPRLGSDVLLQKLSVPDTPMLLTSFLVDSIPPPQNPTCTGSITSVPRPLYHTPRMVWVCMLV